MSASPTTTTRRVLQTLDANTRNPNVTTKSPKVLEASLQSLKDTTLSKTSQDVGDAPLSGTKRSFELDLPRVSTAGYRDKPQQKLSQQDGQRGQVIGAQEQKRIKMNHPSEVHNAADSSVTEKTTSFRSQIVITQSATQPRSPSRLTITASPTYSSPASTCFSSVTGMDDSQDTVLTVPDEAQIIAIASFTATSSQSAHGNLSRAEIRHKAKTLRLRLSLASYKLRTNQTNVPISRLQIRPTSPELPHLPRPEKNGNAGTEKNLGIVKTPKKKRTPLPSSSSPYIDLKNRDALLKDREVKSRDVGEMRMPSSPPREDAGDGGGAKGCGGGKEGGKKGGEEEATTPMLPRQRQEIKDPPRLGSPIWADREREKDLTSSVVKGRAADGLLSLRRVVS